MTRPPRLGSNLPGETRCTRMTGDGPCFKPGAFHVIWPPTFASTACVECVAIAVANYDVRQIHVLVPTCTDLDAMWYPDERTCRIPVSIADMNNGVFILDR